MRRWFARGPDGTDTARLTAQLEAAVAAEAWDEALAAGRRLVTLCPHDVRVLNLAARAARHARPGRGRDLAAQAAAWLNRALDLAPGEVETLDQLGHLALRAHAREAALDYWRRAWTADPDAPRPRAALLEQWRGDGAVPDWGVPVLEAVALDGDEAAVWDLLLPRWEQADELSSTAWRLLRRRYYERGDRSPRLVRLLAVELARLDRFEAATREVFETLGATDPLGGRGLVRCDARRRAFRADALEAYRAAVRQGDLDAALLLAQGALSRQTPLDAAAAAALELCLREAPEPAWRQFGLDRTRATEQLAAWHLPLDPTPAGVAAIEAAQALHPDDLALLRYLARAYRPGLAPAQVDLYLTLFSLAPEERANTSFLAGELIAGRLAAPDSATILEAWLGLDPPDRRPVLVALADALRAAGRADAAALDRLAEAAEAGLLDRDGLAWLALGEARAGRETGRARWRQVLHDPDAPPAVRREVGEALAAAEPQADDLLALAAALAADGAAPAALAALAERLPAADRAAWLDTAACQRFRAGDFARAAALAEALGALRPHDAAARRKADLARARLALHGQGERPATSDAALAGLLAAALDGAAPAALTDLLRAGQPTPAVIAAADVLDGRAPDPRAVALTGDDAWLLAVALQVAGQPAVAAAELAAAEPEARLWERYLAGREEPAAAWAQLAPLARRGEPPWPALHPVVLAVLARHAPLEALPGLAPLLGRDERCGAEARRVAALIDADHPDAEADLTRLAPALPGEVAHSLTAAHGVREAARLLRGGDPAAALARLAGLDPPAPWRDAVAWLRVQAALATDDQGPAAAWVGDLSEAVRTDPATALWLAARLPARAEALLAAALRRHRHRTDLRLALAGLAARAGQLDRFTTWAAPLRADPAWGPRLTVAEQLLTQPLETIDRPDPALALAAARALLLADRPSEAADRLAACDLPEAVNLRAMARWLAGDAAGARRDLAALADHWPAAQHNLAVLAEAGDDLAAAARWREAELATPSADDEACCAAHRALAGLYRRLGENEAELRHLEATLALRPHDAATVRASLQPLLAAGRGAEALERSTRLAHADPALDVQLDHAAVLAATRGAPTAARFLDGLEHTRPEGAEAVRLRRRELFERLAEACRERTAERDWLGLFAAGRDGELVAAEPEERGRAMLHQVVALGNLAEQGEAVARLEQAHARCAEVLTLGVTPALQAQARRLAAQVAGRLGPALAQQAEELLTRRENEYRRLKALDPAPAGAGRLALGLAEAFERVAALFQRASDLGEAACQAAVAPRLAVARDLAVAARRTGEALQNAERDAEDEHGG